MHRKYLKGSNQQLSQNFLLKTEKNQKLPGQNFKFWTVEKSGIRLTGSIFFMDKSDLQFVAAVNKDINIHK